MILAAKTTHVIELPIRDGNIPIASKFINQSLVIELPIRDGN